MIEEPRPFLPAIPERHSHNGYTSTEPVLRFKATPYALKQKREGTCTLTLEFSEAQTEAAWTLAKEAGIPWRLNALPNQPQ